MKFNFASATSYFGVSSLTIYNHKALPGRLGGWKGENEANTGWKTRKIQYVASLFADPIINWGGLFIQAVIIGMI